MNEQTMDAARDPMDDELERAIRAVLSVPVPDQVRASVIQSAATWPLKRFPWAAVLAIAAAALLLIVLGEVNRMRTAEVRTVVQSQASTAPVTNGEMTAIRTTQTRPR